MGMGTRLAIRTAKKCAKNKKRGGSIFSYKTKKKRR